MSEQVEKKILFSQCTYRLPNGVISNASNDVTEMYGNGVYLQLRKYEYDLILEYTVTDEGNQITWEKEALKGMREYEAIRLAVTKMDELVELFTTRELRKKLLEG